MKNIIIIPLILLSLAVFGQPKSSIQGGLNYGLTQIKFKDNSNVFPVAQPDLGFNIGYTYEHVPDKDDGQLAYFQFGLQYTQLKTYYNYADGSDSYSMHLNPAYLKAYLPFNFKQRFGLTNRVFIGVGPYLAYGIAGKVKYSGSIVKSEKIKFGNEDEHNLRRSDIGYMAQAGVEINKFIIGVRYGNSFVNNAPVGSNDTADKSIKHRDLGIQIGFYY